MNKTDWKDKLNTLLPSDHQPEAATPETHITRGIPTKQALRVELDKRKGKTATLITGFEGSEEELIELARTIKNRCAAGGSQRDGEILIQGDFRKKITDILLEMGHKVKRINF